ncbi:phospholipase D [Sphingomonas sp. MM-1]|uniref:phospholipase D-like domain-containing protein n=1 Tax=Sphingomonas sp. MM-1 TaxID=745310 RepID=UPI0002C1372D|nr:phosphatidylserine/phosphatidylglycerophosphate/cardiolipin synthase family protein [Sphingomonas sp. MM-1]AGH50073.1 phospholipase D [Sphingomonas sp. MM-1]
MTERDATGKAIGGDAGRVEHGGDFVVAGNRLALLTEGPERLEALIALIADARASLRLLYYTYAADQAGRAVRDALLAALDRGVRVSLIVDGFGSPANQAFFHPLEARGADICRFIPRFGRRYLLRNHQKLALADDGRALIGGFNIEDAYFVPPSRPEAWRDLGLVVEGPAAERLAGYFDALAAWAATPRARMRDLRRALGQWSQLAGPVRWLIGGPTRRLNPWARAVKDDIRAARRLDMIAAYFIPNPAMVRRIGNAAQRGPVRIVTAAKSDSLSTVAAARHTYRRLLRRGVGIYEFQPCKLHTKLIVVDDTVYIGSANFDIRSLYLNLELMLRIEDRAFADHLHGYVDGECAASRHVTRAIHRRESGWLARLRWRMAYYLLAVVDARLTWRLNFGVDAD